MKTALRKVLLQNKFVSLFVDKDFDVERDFVYDRNNTEESEEDQLFASLLKYVNYSESATKEAFQMMNRGNPITYAKLQQ